MLNLPVYSDTTGSFVSGVGFRGDYEQTTWVAPIDPTLRWDDEANASATLIDVPVMRHPRLNGKHGFVIHEACWQLLQRELLPDEISLKRLLAICESLPFPLAGLGVYWGHDYGHLLVLEGQGMYPWEDALVDDCYNPVTRLYAKEDPYDVPGVSVSMLAQTELLPAWSSLSQSKDCFSKIPWDILESIAIELPTKYALGLRHVSKNYLPLLYSRPFWASRFQPRGDRCFMFEKWESHEATDWLSLYRLTSLCRCSPGLKNRRRIWKLIRPLVETIKLRLAENTNLASFRDQDHASLGWDRVVGDIQEEASDGHPWSFDQGCRIFGTHITYISRELTKIGFSISCVGTVSYVSGIRLIANNQPDICLGFRSKINEVIIEANALKGFVLAMGSRGLHGIQVIREDYSLSEWAGSPSNTPITERLTGFDRIDKLEIGFDVSREFS